MFTTWGQNMTENVIDLEAIMCTLKPHYNAPHYNAVFNITLYEPYHGSQNDYFAICLL